MDEQKLQQKELDLKIKEHELSLREADINNRELRASINLDLTMNTQEFLRRAIEVGAGALQKLYPFTKELEGKVTMMDHLEKLVDKATVKLTEELEKVGK